MLISQLVEFMSVLSLMETREI